MKFETALLDLASSLRSIETGEERIAQVVTFFNSLEACCNRDVEEVQEPFAGGGNVIESEFHMAGNFLDSL